MIVQTNSSVAAYFLMKEYSDDTFMSGPNDLDVYRERIQKFILAMNELYPILSALNTAEDMQFEIYEVGKKLFGEDKKQLRDFFRLCYYAITQTDSGSRLGEIFFIFGVDAVYQRMNDNFRLGVLC